MYKQKLYIQIEMTEHYTVKTDVGVFRVFKETYLDYHRNYKNEFLRIGGKKYCVEYKWNKTKPELVELQWIDVLQGGCEVSDKPIRKEATIHLFDLSLTILKTYTSVKSIELLDNSKFTCILPGDKKAHIFTNYYNYVFHNATWYDSKLGAYPKDGIEKKRYEENKSNATNPEKKPESFDFKNDNLNTEFEPIFESCSTWKEFLDALYAKYHSDNLCARIYPWYMNAALQLTGGVSLPSIWIIDAESRPSIQYEKISTGGGKKRWTRKRRSSGVEEISASELRGLRYV